VLLLAWSGFGVRGPAPKCARTPKLHDLGFSFGLRGALS
jgi:hypothetical protein